MRIAIIGGGLMGLALAYRLRGAGREILVYERGEQLGGLATFHDYGDFFWDRFYHVILPTDKALTAFLEEIGLGDNLRWENTRTGVYVDESFYSVSTTKEFLLFPPLNLFQKFRLALTILLGSRIDDWRKMEKISVEEWLIKYSGRKTYEKFWKPLLMAKLGNSYRRVSAVFIWTYIKRLFEAREDSSAKKEHLGYVEGGYKAVFERLASLLAAGGVDVRTRQLVEKIEPKADSGLQLTINGATESFDKVIFTGPVNVLERVADPALVRISGSSSAVEYLGVICMVLVLHKPLTAYYVLNIADERIPFTGVIGMSTIVDTQQTAGNYLVYLPKYVISTDPLLKKPDDEIKSLFFKGLFQMYPGLSEDDIISVHINRAFKVQPLQVLNYSQIIPSATTRHPDFFILNTSQLVNSTLNNDSVIRHVNGFMKKFGETMGTETPAEKPAGG